MSTRPSFGAELDAMWRQGLKDLQNAVGKAFPDSVQGVSEPGTPLNPTNYEITQDRRGPEIEHPEPDMEH